MTLLRNLLYQWASDHPSSSPGLLEDLIDSDLPLAEAYICRQVQQAALAFGLSIDQSAWNLGAFQYGCTIYDENDTLIGDGRSDDSPAIAALESWLRVVTFLPETKPHSCSLAA